MSNAEGESGLEGLCCTLARGIRRSVLPYLGHPSMRKHAGIAHSGDQSFDYDVLAEKALAEAIEELHMTVAVLSEDRGMRTYGRGVPSITLIVDPIDGTRPACLGLELACVSVAAVRTAGCPTFSDILAGAVVRIKEGACFSATQHGGARLDGKRLLCNPDTPEPVQAIYWSTEVVGRPANELFAHLAPLVDATSRDGGFFIWNSTSYSMSAIASGVLDAHVDAPPRPGAVGLFAYDVAAAYLVLIEAGGICTGVDGQDLGNVRLFAQGGRLQQLRLVASRCQPVQRYMLRYVGTRTV